MVRSLVTAIAVLGLVTAVAADPPLTVSSGPLRFEERLIMKGYTYPYGIAAGDIDGDGKLDITSADALPHNSLYLFTNDGKLGFRKSLVQKDDPDRLERHALGDIDGDGRLDIVIVKNLFGDLLWFRNSGRPAAGLWKRHVITNKKLKGAYDVALGDFDGDGDLDVAASSWRLSNNFAWFENDGTPADGEWTMRIIEADVPETRTIRAADFDRDGDLDLLGTSRLGPRVVWYENSGKPATAGWKPHVIDSKTLQPIHGEPADIDGDGDLDVLMAFGMTFASQKKEQVLWYENDGKGGGWTPHVITQGFEGAFEAVAVDLDGDKDIDVVATGWGDPGQVAWFENTGDPRRGWRKHMIKTNWRRANQVIIGDFDGDKRPDIAACAERGTLELRWWRNLGSGKIRNQRSRLDRRAKQRDRSTRGRLPASSRSPRR